MSAGAGRLEIPHDEDFFAGPDEPQLAPRQFLDGRRVFPQVSCLLAEARVLGSQSGDRGGQFLVLTASPAHREQPMVPHECIHDHDDPEKDRKQPTNAPGACRTSRNCGPAFG